MVHKQGFVWEKIICSPSLAYCTLLLWLLSVCATLPSSTLRCHIHLARIRHVLSPSGLSYLQQAHPADCNPLWQLWRFNANTHAQTLKDRERERERCQKKLYWEETAVFGLYKHTIPANCFFILLYTTITECHWLSLSVPYLCALVCNWNNKSNVKWGFTRSNRYIFHQQQNMLFINHPYVCIFNCASTCWLWCIKSTI